MFTVLDLIEIYPDYSLMLEILVIGIVIALIGAGGYVLFAYSMRDDRGDKRSSRVYNPWESLSEQSVEKPSKSEEKDKSEADKGE